MSSLLSGMVQLVISHSSCSKAAKIFKKSAIFKHKGSPSMPCVAGHVTTNPGKRSDAFHSTSENSEKFKPVIFVEWKAPLVTSCYRNWNECWPDGLLGTLCRLPPSELPFAERVLVQNVSHENRLIFMRMTVQVTYIFILIVHPKTRFATEAKVNL